MVREKTDPGFLLGSIQGQGRGLFAGGVSARLGRWLEEKGMCTHSTLSGKLSKAVSKIPSTSLRIPEDDRA